MSQAGIVNTTIIQPTVPTTFVEDVGSATPVLNIINIVGGVGIATSGSGNTVTITSTASSSITFNTASGSATTSGGSITFSGAGGLSFSGSGSTVTGTLSAIPNASLVNSSITINTTGSLSGGGTVSLGGTITINGTASGTVTSVSGTTNRITSTGGTTPIIDISASYVGQTSITTLGTVTTGTWIYKITTPGAYPYTTLANDQVILVDTSSARTITPLAGPTTGQTYRIKDSVGSAASNNITITPSGKNIDGAASYVINLAYGSVDITYNGTEWSIL